VHTEVGCRHLERAACTGARFFKYQSDILSLAKLVGNIVLFLCLELGSVVYKIVDLFGRKVQKLEKMFVFKVHFFVSPPRNLKEYGVVR